MMQRMLKRGVEMLRMEDYQILYCEPGLATGDELERLKIMSSSEYFVRLSAHACWQLPSLITRKTLLHTVLLTNALQCRSMYVVGLRHGLAASWLMA